MAEEDIGMELKDPLREGYMKHPLELLDLVQEHWLGSFLLNILGYALIIVPAALLIRRWKQDPYVKRG